MKKKIASGLLCAMLVLSCTMFANAHINNHDDTTFDFDFTRYYDAYTGVRQKNDTTSSYMKCQTSSYSYTAKVYAEPDTNSNKIDVSNGYTYQFNQGSVFKMRNWAKEWGYNWAGIQGISGNQSYHATGLWSPDSV